jgi:hypothetical protein
MQLSLTTTLPRHPRAAVLRPLVPLSREAAMSQLDQIAQASGQRIVRQDGLGGASAVLALIGGLLVVGAAAMWRAPAEAVPVVQVVQAPTVVVAPTQPVAPVVPAVETPTFGAQRAVASEAPAATAVAALVEALPPAAEPSPDELARKARARQLAEARRKAAVLAQERLAAVEAQRLQAAAQRRETELQTQADEQRRAAADAAARQAQAITVAMNTRRSVRETCNGRGLFAEGACHMRECARSEYQADPVCVRQRENDEAQRRASIER